MNKDSMSWTPAPDTTSGIPQDIKGYYSKQLLQKIVTSYDKLEGHPSVPMMTKCPGCGAQNHGVVCYSCKAPL